MSVVILFSGGQDSSCLLEIAQKQMKDVYCLHFIYDHPARDIEFFSAKKICDVAAVSFTHIELQLSAYEMDIGVGEPGARVVPNRNAIFLSYAIHYAAQNNINEIWFGANANDQRDYIDCRQEFIDAMNAVASAYDVFISAPLITTKKSQISSKYSEYATSCYQPIYINGEWEQCGQCNSCLENTAQIIQN